jgi:hypothetical protein
MCSGFLRRLLMGPSCRRGPPSLTSLERWPSSLSTVGICPARKTPHSTCLVCGVQICVKLHATKKPCGRQFSHFCRFLSSQYIDTYASCSAYRPETGLQARLAPCKLADRHAVKQHMSRCSKWWLEDSPCSEDTCNDTFRVATTSGAAHTCILAGAR